MKESVLFICTHNSARFQIAEGLLNALFPDRYEAFSAGTEPLEVHPLAIQVMKEIGIDISGHRSKSLDEFQGREFDYVVTVCDTAHQKAHSSRAARFRCTRASATRRVPMEPIANALKPSA